MKPGAVAASRSGGGTVAFSWEKEPGLSKQSAGATEAKKPTAGAPRAEAVSRRTTAAAKKAPAPAAVQAHPNRLRVPPPPGRPGATAVSSAGKSSSRARSRGVRPRDDPFLAAYLACTDNGSNGGRDCGRGTTKLVGWAGLGFGLGLGLRGLGLSCKSSCGAVEECVVRLARIPGLDED